MANEGPGGGADGAVLEALAGGGPAWWRPCLVEDPEALPGGGPAWWRTWRPCLVEDVRCGVA